MESLLLQETGGGYFTLENGSGRILLELSGPAGGEGQHGAGRIMDEVDIRELIRRNDDEISALVTALL